MRIHIKWEELRNKIIRRTPFIEPIHGSPFCEIYLKPNCDQIGLKIKGKNYKLRKRKYANVNIQSLQNKNDIDISCTEPSVYRAFFDIAREISDLVQIEKKEVVSSIYGTLAKYEKILQRVEKFSKEKEIGLLGELIFFLKHLNTQSLKKMTNAWNGPDSEEHDFVFGDTDFEIKTTSMENREHRISSISQLMPKYRRSLFLVSYMVTPGVGISSVNLKGLVDDIRSKLKKDKGSTEEQFTEKIRLLGACDMTLRACTDSYLHRRSPLLIKVDRKLPKITPANLLTDTSKIIKCGYSINIDNYDIRKYQEAYNTKIFSI